MTTANPADRITELLETGAAAADSRYQRAAIHLLVFTGLLSRSDFAAHIEHATIDLDGRETPAAFIRDWAALGRLEGLGYLSGGEERLIRLAASMAHGALVDLRAALSSLGYEHARRVLEAVTMCLDADKYFTINPTPALIEEQQFHEQLLAGELRRRGLNADGTPL